jgi:hypothetical protein
LLEAARTKKVVYTCDLARSLHLKDGDPPLRVYLDPIYEEEMRAGRPALTLVVVNKDTGLCFYNSRGLPARTVRIDRTDEESLATYFADLEGVWAYWATH